MNYVSYDTGREVVESFRKARAHAIQDFRNARDNALSYLIEGNYDLADKYADIADDLAERFNLDHTRTSPVDAPRD